MPGPVSDSYDPEFGTGAVADEVARGLYEVVDRVSRSLASERKNIVDVVRGRAGRLHDLALSERELRIIRFGLERALESL